jgi:membrane protein DedA with SNARE-associated domain
MDDIFLTTIMTYGPWALGAATLVSALGLPLPMTVVLLGVGALMQQGLLNWPSTVSLAVLGAVLGDSAGYLAGRYVGVLASRSAPASVVWAYSQSAFGRWGGLSIFFSRFLLTPLALPINLIAGSAGYKLWQFIGSAALGELLWVLAFSGLGYTFGSQLEMLNAIVGGASQWIVAGVLGVALFVKTLTGWRKWNNSWRCLPSLR